jgi:hypothetical protein
VRTEGRATGELVRAWNRLIGKAVFDGIARHARQQPRAALLPRTTPDILTLSDVYTESS